MRLSRQEYWSGLPRPSSGDLPSPGIKPASPALAGGFFTAEPPGRPSSFIRSTFIGHFSANRHGHRHQETRDREEGSPGWGRGSLNPAWRPTQVFIEGLQGGSLQNWALKEARSIHSRGWWTLSQREALLQEAASHPPATQQELISGLAGGQPTHCQGPQTPGQK